MRWSRRRLRALSFGILLLRVRGLILLGPTVGLPTRNAIAYGSGGARHDCGVDDATEKSRHAGLGRCWRPPVGGPQLPACMGMSAVDGDAQIPLLSRGDSVAHQHGPSDARNARPALDSASIGPSCKAPLRLGVAAWAG